MRNDKVEAYVIHAIKEADAILKNNNESSVYLNDILNPKLVSNVDEFFKMEKLLYHPNNRVSSLLRDYNFQMDPKKSQFNRISTPNVEINHANSIDRTMFQNRITIPVSLLRQAVAHGSIFYLRPVNDTLCLLNVADGSYPTEPIHGYADGRVVVSKNQLVRAGLVFQRNTRLHAPRVRFSLNGDPATGIKIQLLD